MAGLTAGWSDLASEHEAAVTEYCAAVRKLPRSRWVEPLAEGKWSPAEVTSHLADSYELLRAELAGGRGMRVVVPPVRRWFLRLVYLPRLLRTGRFPPGVRAPRETRPRNVQQGPEEGITELERQAAGFLRELGERASRGPVSLSHAYFGALSAKQGVRLATVHTRHHARQVAGAG